MKKIILLLIAGAFSQIVSAQSKSWIEGGLSVVGSYRTLKSNGDSMANRIVTMRDTLESPLPTFGFFASYNRRLNKRLSLGAGLSYERLGFRTVMDATYLRFSDTTTPPQSIPEKIIFMDLYHVVRIPISLNYAFVKKNKFSLAAIAGISADFMVSKRGKSITYYSGDKRVRNDPSPFLNANAAVFSFSAGMGAEYQLAEKSGLTCRVLYSQNLTSYFSAPITQHLQWVALSFGYKYSL